MSKISVAMTTYNGEKFLQKQLDSITKQSRQVDELIVCDDGSNDNTVNILNGFYNTAPFPVKVIINEKNLGSTKNFEKCMALCEGDIIILCDQDDVWLTDKVKILEEMFLSNPNCEMAFTNAMTIDETGKPLNELLWSCFRFNEKKQKLLKNGKGLRCFAGENVVTGAASAVKKSFFEKTRPFPVDLVHDHWLATIAVLNKSLFFSNVITINYRIHPSQQLGLEIDTNNKKLIKKININNLCDHNIVINKAEITIKELNKRFHLTDEQRKIFIDKIKFYSFRENLIPNRLIRSSKIFSNMLCGNYHKFTNGFLSVAKDLLRNAGGIR